MIIGILPACGDAIRMEGIAKFNLNIPQSNETLISWHVKSLMNYCDKVVVVVKKEHKHLLYMFNDNKKVIILVEQTSTMSETILRAIKKFYADEYVIGMPDTFVVGDNPYKSIITDNPNSDLNIGAFKIKNIQKGKLGQIDISNNIVLDCVDKNINCDYKHSWGFLRFKRSMIKLIDKKTPHLGYIVNPAIINKYSVTASIINGEYFDCGTQDEYEQFLKYMHGV